MKIWIVLALLLANTALFAEFDHYGLIDTVEGNLTIVKDLSYRLTITTRVIAHNGSELATDVLAAGQWVGVLHDAINPQALE